MLRFPIAGAVAFVFALATLTWADPDLWGHLRFGLDMIATRELPPVDPYSFTQDKPWVNHEWLSELVTALAWKAGGTAGLALLKGALVGGAAVLVWRALAPVHLSARIVIAGLVALGVAPVARTLRPQLWTLLFLAVLCHVLVAPQIRRRQWLPVLFAAWANLHGGWIVGIGVLGMWLGVETVMARRLDARAVAIGMASVLATLLTPYGWHLWAFLGTTVRMQRDITEWQPLWNSAPLDALPWIGGVAVAVWLARYSIRDKSARVAVLAMLAFSSARVIRIAPLFVMCVALLLADALAARWPRRVGRLLDPSPHDRLAAMVVTVATLAATAWVGSTSLRCVLVDTPWSADGAAVRLLRTAQPGRLVTFFNWGEYAIWHLGPRLRVSMDGRRETVYSDTRLAEHAAILEGRPEGFAVLASWRPEYVWLPATSAATREWLVLQGYRLEHDTEHSFVAVRPDLPALVPPLPGEAGPASPDAATCFPG